MKKIAIDSIERRKEKKKEMDAGGDRSCSVRKKGQKKKQKETMA